MLVQFRSPATETITLFGDAAVELLKLMGATGRVPGGLSAEDVPPALQRLESAVEGLKARTNADTAARPAGSGLGQCRRAWSLIQRITLCAETPRRLPIALSDRPVQ